jgi:hypothetical protein
MIEIAENGFFGHDIFLLSLLHDVLLLEDFHRVDLLILFGSHQKNFRVGALANH